MKTWSDETVAWMALYLIPGLGNNTFRRLLERFGTPGSVLEAPLEDLTRVEGLRKKVACRIVKREFSSDPVRERERAEKAGARLITFADPAYPRLLKEIPSPPMVLYAKGRALPADQAFVAVVGSRHPTHYGLKAAEKVAQGLAQRKVGVVSGLAKGVDAAAHRGCLMGQGHSVGVLGTGIDVVYPPSNKKLFSQMLERGTLLSEFPMGSPPEPRNFPIRNRIISGLSKGVVVVEATKQSGSLITAALALEQGREIFAVPGSIDSFKSRGAHFLIKQGAKLIENADDVLEEILFPHASQRGEGDEATGLQEPVDLDDCERRIYDIIGNFPMHIDEIVRLGGMGAGEVSGVLMGMELKGIVKQLPGKLFVK